MHRIHKIVLIIGVIAYFISMMVACDRSENPLPISGYFLTMFADPDSIPNTGAVSSISAIVRDRVDSSQVGGLHLEFSAPYGDLTSTATSSASSPNGTVTPVYFDCNACEDSITLVLIRGELWSAGALEDVDTVYVIVYLP